MINRLYIYSFILLFFFISGCLSNVSEQRDQPQNTNDITLANLNLSIAYIKEKDYERAFFTLKRAKEADPNYAPIYNVYGLLYQTIKEDDKAEHNYKKAIKLNKNESSTMNNYGNFLCQKGQYDKAQEIFKQAADNPLYKTPYIAISNAGLCAYNNNHIEEAEKYFRHALELNKTLPNALIKMSEISFDKNDYLSARGYLQRYQQITKHSPKSLWLGIQVESNLGDKDAVASYSLLLKNNFPDSKEAEKNSTK